MDVSLFKRLSERHPQALVNLEHQYRMHQDIMELSNSLIYENRLKCGTEHVATSLLHMPRWDELVSYIREHVENSQGLSDTLQIPKSHIPIAIYVKVTIFSGY